MNGHVKEQLEDEMKRNLEMLEKEILDLMNISIVQLSTKVGSQVQYCTNIAGKQNESNYFVVNDDIAEIGFTYKGKTGYIECHSKDDYERPVGARFYVDCDNYLRIQNQTIKKKRRRLGKPKGWKELLTTNAKKAIRYFHRGHIIAYSLGGDKEIHGRTCKALISLFVQTAWSNMGKDVNKKGFDNKFSQWHFEEKVTKALKNSSVCLDCRPIYRDKADIIPIGIHLQAVTENESLFNVFIPNIDPNIKINYKNCTFELKK